VSGPAKANKQLRQAHRADILMRQVEDWTPATQIDRYLAAMETAVNAMAEGEDRSAAREWLDWGRRYRQRLDPLNHSLAMPEDPKPTADNLKPYLGGSSFCAPDELSSHRKFKPPGLVTTTG
jgi:hypothetical protein